eukprot:CAMPEP_0114491274 /NCGR_PEP_ID=MMETSP0109-20121206/2911_1 /TAXON_ID=29199 /ORGANISM="Chlorarachnion reptans, Strain CCCM449" /LENGTH=159 /DNA_ID=CAMNT_0001667993 /DNA_START=591 /DNA_END=1070 /DNA_ORIENTATION=+
MFLGAVMNFLRRLLVRNQQRASNNLSRARHNHCEVPFEIRRESFDLADHQEARGPRHGEAKESVDDRPSYGVVLRMDQEHDPYHRRIHTPKHMPAVVPEGQAPSSNVPSAPPKDLQDPRGDGQAGDGEVLLLHEVPGGVGIDLAIGDVVRCAEKEDPQP